MASVTVAQLAVELPFLVAIQADAHGADDFPAYWIEAVTDPAVAVTTGYTCGLAVDHGVVRRAQPVFWELGGQVGVTGDADLGVADAWVSDYAFMGDFALGCGCVAIVAGCAAQPAMGVVCRMGFDG